MSSLTIATLPLCFARGLAAGVMFLLPLSALAQAAASRPASAASAASAVSTAGAANAASPTSATADALASCERAARQSLASRGAPASDLKFTGSPTEPPGAASDSLLVLHGTASWRSPSGVRRFEYICNVDPRSPDAVGLAMRDTTPAADLEPARPPLEPDLSHLSPTACESSAASALKKRWPRVTEISFDTGTRSLSQESAVRAELHGQGRALPAPGSPVTHFSFDCQVDPRDGRVLGTRISG